PAIDAVLAADPALAASVAAEPGVRLPRAVDGFELAVRAIVGQQISVPAARTVLARLVAATGEPFGPVGPAVAADADHRGRRRTPSDEPAEPRAVRDPPREAGSDGRREARVTPREAGSDGRREARAARAAPRQAGVTESGGPPPHAPGSDEPEPGDGAEALAWLFPDAAAVANAPDDAFAMPAARRRTIQALAEAVAAGELSLDGGADRAETEQRLRALPGIGAWTADYVALRALGDPDVFLA